MHALIGYFFALAMLRRGPQDLPASTVLLALLAVANVLVGTATGSQIFGGVRPAFGANVVDLALSMVTLFVLLQFKGHAARWVQTATAFFGLGALAGVLMLLFRSVADMVGARELAMLSELIIAVWVHVALGHVLRHALDVPLLAGVVIVLAYSLMAFNIIAQFFPPNIPGS